MAGKLVGWVAGLLAVTASGPLFAADWQATTWDMGVEDVIQATGAEPVVGTPDQRLLNADLGAAGSYSAMGFDFRSLFFFDAAGRLRGVRLVLHDTLRCDDLQAAVEGVYGRSAGEGTTMVDLRWVDSRSGDAVAFFYPLANRSKGCSITYSPRITEGAQGL